MFIFFCMLSGLLFIFFFLNMEFIELGIRLGLKDEDLREFDKNKEIEKFERDERVVEREVCKIEKEIELEMIKREIELQRQKNLEIVVVSVFVLSQVKFFKLLVFEEINDCIDFYLQRFERFVFNVKWEEFIWVINFSVLLKGKVLDVYFRLFVGEVFNYRCLKQVLLK